MAFQNKLHKCLIYPNQILLLKRSSSPNVLKNSLSRVHHSYFHAAFAIKLYSSLSKRDGHIEKQLLNICHINHCSLWKCVNFYSVYSKKLTLTPKNITSKNLSLFSNVNRISSPAATTNNLDDIWVCFADRVPVCEKEPSEILLNTSHFIKQNQFPPEGFSIVFRNLAISTYNSRFKFTHPYDYKYLRKNRPTGCEEQSLMKNITDNPTFQTISNVVVENIKDISDSDVIRILYYLDSLGLRDCDLWNKLYTQALCLSSEKLCLEDIAMVSCFKDIEILSNKIIEERTRKILSNQQQVNGGDLSLIYKNLKSFLQESTVDLFAKKLCEQAQLVRGNRLVEMLGTIGFFNLESESRYYEMFENVVFKTLNCSNLSFKNVTNSSVDTCLNAGSILLKFSFVGDCQIVKELQKQLVIDFKSCETAEDFIKVTSFINKEHILGQEDEFTTKVYSYLKDSDWIIFSKVCSFCHNSL